jgi:hypothetical protein
MKLTKDELNELNIILKNRNIVLPDFRKVVSNTGQNYNWLRKHIVRDNPNISSRLKYLLSIS